jgi:formylglycine-generating enzyme required for sulfatase activity
MSRSLPLGRCLAVILLSSVAVGVVLLDASQAQPVTGKRYALLVGVRTYDHKKLEDLKYTENDIEELALELKGFTEVVVLTSTRGEKKAEAAPTAANIRAQLGRLLRRVTKHDTVVVGLAGHGLQLKVKDRKVEEGFFCPLDARPREDVTLAQQSETMIGFTELFKALDESGVGVKLLLIDACRNDPEAGRSVNADAMPRAPKGMAALFSCRSGERAFETAKLGKGHGVFFHFVLEGLRGKAKNARGEVTWGTLSEYVVEKVSDEVPVLIGDGAKQTPEEIRKLEGKPPVLVGPESKEIAAGPKAITNSIGMKLMRIPAGTFTMGSSREEEDHEEDEGPTHEVEITKPFYMGAFEVTQRQYRAVMGTNPSHFSRTGRGRDAVKDLDTDDLPVESVSWADASTFCKKLSALSAERKAGRTYRLPTEAEWEYACRAGTQTPFHVGRTLTSGEAVIYGTRPKKVGSYKPNVWGLYDMHGNVWEWCADWYDEDYYPSSPRKDPQGPEDGELLVIRGGSYNNSGAWCRSAGRGRWDEDARLTNLGFRVVCTPGASR